MKSDKNSSKITADKTIKGTPIMNCLPFLGHKKWEAFLWLETLCTTSG